jgi:hypothetical protein
MNKFFDVIVAKEYTVNINGINEKRTAWNQIGRAWASASGASLNFELYHLPNQRYVIQIKKPEKLNKGDNNENSSL